MFDGPIGFAGVYDLIYAGPVAFYAAQMRFLLERLGPVPARILDAGCGTGRHVLALARRGYQVWGVDADPAMLHVAHAKLAAAGQPARLCVGDLRALPCAAACQGILCLESPLAYLLDDDELAAALAGLRRNLAPGGRLLIDVFDYPGTVGREGSGPQTAIFYRRGCTITVIESHRPALPAGRWRMRQEIAFQGPDDAAPRTFTVEHTFALRQVEDYTAALKDAGFVIDELRDRYPGAPASTAHEQRMIFVARSA
jgi:SAM-dependent methyltransferase